MGTRSSASSRSRTVTSGRKASVGSESEDVGASASVVRGSRARTALWVSCAVRAAQALSGAPFTWFGKNAAQFYFASDDGTRPFFSMSMWCAVIHVRTVLETLIVLRHGEERVEERWVCGLAMGNYLQAGLLMFEGAQGRGVGRHNITLDSFVRSFALSTCFVLMYMYSSVSAQGVATPVRKWYKPACTAHAVMLINWVMLTLYALSFAYADPVELYYFKIGSKLEYVIVNYLAVGIWSCVFTMNIAMSSFPPVLQKRYCLLHLFIECLCVVVIVFQENAYTFLKDGTVDRQWMNHLTVKFTLSIPWVYGYFAKDGV